MTTKTFQAKQEGSQVFQSLFEFFNQPTSLCLVGIRASSVQKLSKFILVIIPVCPDNTVYAKLLLPIPSLQEWYLFVFDEFLGGLDNIYAHKDCQTQKTS